MTVPHAAACALASLAHILSQLHARLSLCPSAISSHRVGGRWLRSVAQSACAREIESPREGLSARAQADGKHIAVRLRIFEGCRTVQTMMRIRTAICAAS